MQHHTSAYLHPTRHMSTSKLFAGLLWSSSMYTAASFKPHMPIGPTRESDVNPLAPGSIEGLKLSPAL